MTETPHVLHDVTGDGTCVEVTVTLGGVSHRVCVEMPEPQGDQDGEWLRKAAIEAFRVAEIERTKKPKPGPAKQSGGP